VFFTTDLFSGLVWSFPLNTNRKKSPYTIESLSLSLSLSLSSRKNKIEKKTLVQSIPFKDFGTEQNDAKRWKPVVPSSPKNFFRFSSSLAPRQALPRFPHKLSPRARQQQQPGIDSISSSHLLTPD
jgi:hypothetical protein